jgi:geranylgeranyl reductase family protein
MYMNEDQFDAVVVGAGPAGSVAALVLARGGAHVALVDKARFPRDKACGDLIGPRGVALLSELEVQVAATRTVSDLRVLGFGGHEISMWCQTTGDGYAPYASYVKRAELDEVLFNEAVRQGAVPIHGRVGDPIRDDTGRLIGLSLDSGRTVRAQFFVGADGSTTRLGHIENLVDPNRGIWCFAIRTYLPSSLDTPHIIFWDEKTWRAFPGYGWIFPDGTGCANVGVGIGIGSNRSESARATRELDEFINRMRQSGLIEAISTDRLPHRRLGGWLRMGLSGTRVASRNVLLAGDAAALVNPYQGEGISQAMVSGQAAAQTILNRPGIAAHAYSSTIWNLFGQYEAPAATMQTTVLRHLRFASVAGRMLTRWPLSAALGESLAIYLSQLSGGAAPGRAIGIANAIESLAKTITFRSKMRRDIEGAFRAQDGVLGSASPTEYSHKLAANTLAATSVSTGPFVDWVAPCQYQTEGIHR